MPQEYCMFKLPQQRPTRTALSLCPNYFRLAFPTPTTILLVLYRPIQHRSLGPTFQSRCSLIIQPNRMTAYHRQQHTQGATIVVAVHDKLHTDGRSKLAIWRVLLPCFANRKLPHDLQRSASSKGLFEAFLFCESRVTWHECSCLQSRASRTHRVSWWQWRQTRPSQNTGPFRVRQYSPSRELSPNVS